MLKCGPLALAPLTRIPPYHKAGSSLIMFCLIDPGLFRPVHSLVAGVGGRAEVLALAATTTEEGSLGLNDLTLGDPAPSATVHPAANPDRWVGARFDSGWSPR